MEHPPPAHRPAHPPATIRVAGPDDAEGIREVYRPWVEGSAVSFEYTTPDAAEVRERIARTLPHHPWLVADDGHGVVGYAYAHAFAERDAYRWSAETSIYLDRAVHRRGVGTALYRSLLAILELQGYRQAFAGVTLPNVASVAMHEALGFRPVAVYHRVGWKFGTWHDVGWWQRPVGSVDSDPAPPVTLDHLDPGDLAAALAADRR